MKATNLAADPAVDLLHEKRRAALQMHGIAADGTALRGIPEPGLAPAGLTLLAAAKLSRFTSLSVCAG